jgi:hypothetical protein
MRTKTLKSMNTADLSRQLSDAIPNAGLYTIAFIFCSPEHDLKTISHVFDNLDIDLVGCTTAGEILNEELHESSIVCMLLNLNRAHYHIKTFVNTLGVFETSQEARRYAETCFTNPAMLVSSAGVFNDGEQVVAGLKEGFDREFPIFGGLAGDNLNVINTFVFSRKDVVENGLLIVVFNNDKIQLNGLATSGWQAIGAYHTVTKAKGNTIYTINNEPALDYFIKFFGYLDDANVKDKPISTISAQYPLQIRRLGTDYSVLRSPISGSEVDRSLTLVGSVKEGDQFRFSISPGIEVIDQTVNEFERFHEAIPEADALILYSCKGRHAALGPYIEDEIKGIQNHWNKPMIGFLSYGEIGNLNNSTCEFHNETCSLVLIKEI